MKFDWKNNYIYYCNFVFILIFIPIKTIDFWMSLEYIGTNNIIEANPLGYIFLENPLITFLIFIGFILFYVIFNVIIHKKFQELIYLLLIILVLSNLIGIYILFNNFQIFLEVFN